MEYYDRMFRQERKKKKKKKYAGTSLYGQYNDFETDNHYVSLKVLCERLDTDLYEGLPHTDAKLRLVFDGPNTLEPAQKKRKKVVSVLYTFFGGFSVLLWLGAIVSFIIFAFQKSTDHYATDEYLYIGLVLLIVVFASGLLAYIQESKTTRIMDTFKQLIPHYATCVRNGEVTTVLAEDVVVGDIVVIRCGDRVPADLRIFKSDNLKVNNSTLTGETDTLVRSPRYTHKNPLETENLAFLGTSVMDGIGHGIAIACGANTVIGRITQLTGKVEQDQIPISKEIVQFVKFSSFVSIVLGLTLFFSALFMDVHVMDASLILLGVVVATVPMGLAPTVSVCLTLTAKRLALKNCLVKRLEAVETLGATSTICTDKTGTLTQNVSTVSHIWINKKIFPADTSEQRSNVAFNTNNQNVQALVLCAALCNNAEFAINQEDVPIPKKKTIGTPTESALLKFAELIYGDVSQVQNRFPKVAEIPFNSTDKFQLSIHELEPTDDDYFFLVMKGAPEKVIERCTTILYKLEDHILSDDLKDSLLEGIISLGMKGERVLGFCDCNLSRKIYNRNYRFRNEPEPNFPTSGYRFLGLISILDPPRASVPDAVTKCRNAGIKVIMITGDHPITAKEIAKSVGIITEPTIQDIAEERGVPVDEVDPHEANACVIHGWELKQMRNEELDAIIYHHSEIVFARTTPKQKLFIVESCQRRGEIVAVTGDGVNDSPALKKADIGVAMGVVGSDISKNAADMILLDDNFATIVTGIEEGRLIYDNLKKSIAYALASNIPEILPFVAFLFFDIPLPISAIAILCIDLGTDLLPGISLAYEKPESDLMRRLPRDPAQDHLVNQKLVFLTYFQIGPIEAAAGFFSYFAVMSDHGFLPQRLKGLRVEWDDKNNDDVIDSYGQEWTYHDRKQLEYKCHTAFLVSIVVMQWVGVIICKTRRNSILRQGMDNHLLNFALVFETVMAAFLCYCPGTNETLRLASITYYYWFLSFPFAVILLVYDEVRRYFIRRRPEGFFAEETYY